MDTFNDTIKQLRIINERLLRQRKTNLDYLNKEYSPENKLKELQGVVDSIETPRKQSYEYLLSQRKDFHTELKKTVDNFKRMKSPLTIVRPIDYINGVIPTQAQYNEIYESINNINWIEINNSIDNARGILDYSFINLFPQSYEFTQSIYEHICKINDEELTEIFTKTFLYKITKDWWIFPRFSLKNIKNSLKKMILLITLF